MTTHADEILGIAHRATREAISLSGRDHAVGEFKVILTRLGSAVEVFLKDHVYLGKHNRWHFEKLIDELEPLGVSAEDRLTLNCLRLAYNEAKHDPHYNAPIQVVTSLLARSEDALRSVANLKLGDSFQPSIKKTRRLIWFAAWDHFIGGDTEFSLFLPCSLDVDFPPSFETIYLKMEAWEQIKAELSRVGSFCLGPACIPDKYFQHWRAGEDFLDAGSFEGDLRSLITVLARHERVESILPELKREAEPYSMLAAALFATTDLAQSSILSDNSGLLHQSIIATAESHYAAPRTSELLNKYAASISEMVCGCEVNVRELIHGPLWVGSARFAELDSERLLPAKHLDVMVLRNGCLVAKI